MIERGEIHTLAGFVNHEKDGGSSFLNFIMSNGTRSTQIDEYYPTKYTHMIPENALNKIRSVTILFFDYIYGFSFFDKDGEELWKIGYTTESLWSKKETVVLEENEVIVGVVAKLFFNRYLQC